VLALLALAGAEDLPAAKEVRPLQPFSELKVSGSVDVYIDFARDAAPELRGSGSVLQGLRLDSSDDELRLDTTRVLTPEADPSLELRTPAIDGIAIVGSADVHLSNFDGERLRVRVAGSGDAIVQGKCGTLEVELAGSGNVRAEGLEAGSVTVKLIGSGDVHVHAVRTLDVKLIGSGDVHYSGSPEITQSVLGSGDVVAADGD
jgi:hypothetical protein